MHRRCSSLISTARVGAAVCWCGLLVWAGCGSKEPSLGKLVPVEGKITLDGTPLTDGEVRFVPVEKDTNVWFRPRGLIEAGGTYRLTTKGQPGAPLGKYRVVLTRGEDRKLWIRVNPQYYNEEKTPLQVEVAENKPEGGYDLNVPSKRRRR